MTENRINNSILQVLPALESGGVERGVVDVSTFGVKQGYKILVASNGGKLVEQLDAGKVKHLKMNLNTKNPFKIFVNIFKLQAAIKKHNIKIVHARSRAPAWSAYFACKLTGTIFITTFHGFYKSNFPLKKFYNSVMMKGDVVIAVSNFIKKHMLKNYNSKGKKIEVIHRGVNLSEFDIEKVTEEELKDFRGNNGINDNDKIIFLPGRITRWKGQDVAIRAFAKLKNRNNIKLLIGGGWKGKEDYYQELVKLCQDNNLEKNVIFAGLVKNMPQALRASDIVLNCSVEPETFGRVTAEANAMGRPAISSAHGGSIEILEGKDSGTLVEVRNDEALAKAIEDMFELLEDPTKKAELEEKAVKNVRDNFSLELMCKKTFAIYDRLLG